MHFDHLLSIGLKQVTYTRFFRKCSFPSFPKFQAMGCANERQAFSPPAQLTVPLKSCARLSKPSKPCKPFLSLSRLFAGLRRQHFDGSFRFTLESQDCQIGDHVGERCAVKGNQVLGFSGSYRSRDSLNVTLTNLRGARLEVFTKHDRGSG